MDDARYERLCERHAEWLSGWSLTHDYDPTWDYTVDFDRVDHPLHQAAVATLRELCARAGELNLPFDNGRVYPCTGLGDGCVARYISGTSSEPVLAIDIAAHIDGLDEAERERAVAQTVVHELRHACQEALGLDPDEHEAEHGSPRLPF